MFHLKLIKGTHFCTSPERLLLKIPGLFNFYLFSMCGCFACMCVCVQCACGAQWNSEEGIVSLELQLETVVSLCEWNLGPLQEQPVLSTFLALMSDSCVCI